MRSEIIKISSVALLPLGLLSCKQQSADDNSETSENPNVVILFADDLGYTDLNCYGGIPNTPHLDSLAENGIKFTNCYAAAPNCSPSRAALLTGRHPSRTGIYSYIPGHGNHPMHLGDEEVTLAELLKTKGYQTVHLGKWHLGSLMDEGENNQPLPSDQGFDYSLGTENNAQPSHYNPVNFVRNGKALDTLKGYSCQFLVDEAKTWLNNHHDEQKPFFLYCCFHEVHKKIASPPELIENYDQYNERNAEYYANVENMDLAVGRLLKILREKGEMENTLVFFTSDNGSYHKGSQKGLSGYKGEVYEGGIRVPGIVHWPGHYTEKRTIGEPVWGPDLLPTLCNLIDVPLPDKNLDGTNLLPLLENKGFERKKPLLWYFYRSNPEASMRVGDYSLMAYANDSVRRTHYFSEKDIGFIKQSEFKQFKLYDLSNDPQQQNNLAKSMPRKLDSMKKVFKSTFEDIREEAPVWQGLPGYDPERARLKWKYERHRGDD
jgi:arylsulfatase A